MPSNIMRMKLLGKAVRFDTLSYALIRFHICLHMLWYASIIWIVWSHQKVCHFKCERLWFYTLIYAFIHSKTLSYAMIHFLCAFIIFHTLSICFYFASTLLSFTLKRFHTLSYAFKCFNLLSLSFYFAHILLSYAFIHFHKLSYAFYVLLFCFYIAFQCFHTLLFALWGCKKLTCHPNKKRCCISV